MFNRINTIELDAVIENFLQHKMIKSYLIGKNIEICSYSSGIIDKLLLIVSKWRFLQRNFKKRIGPQNKSLIMVLISNFIDSIDFQNLFVNKEKETIGIQKKVDTFKRFNLENYQNLELDLYLSRNRWIFDNFCKFLCDCPYVAQIGFSPNTLKLDLLKDLHVAPIYENLKRILSRISSNPENTGEKLAIIEAFITKMIDNTMNSLYKQKGTLDIYTHIFSTLRKEVDELSEQEKFSYQTDLSRIKENIIYYSTTEFIQNNFNNALEDAIFILEEEYHDVFEHEIKKGGFIKHLKNFFQKRNLDQKLFNDMISTYSKITIGAFLFLSIKKGAKIQGESLKTAIYSDLTDLDFKKMKNIGNGVQWYYKLFKEEGFDPNTIIKLKAQIENTRSIKNTKEVVEVNLIPLKPNNLHEIATGMMSFTHEYKRLMKELNFSKLILPKINILQIMNDFKFMNTIDYSFDESRALSMVKRLLKKDAITTSDLNELNEGELMEVFQNPPHNILEEIIEIIKTVNFITSEFSILNIDLRGNEISIVYEKRRFLENVQKIIRSMDKNTILIKSYRCGNLNEDDLRNTWSNELEKEYSINKEEVIRTDRPADLEIVDKKNQNFSVCAEFKFYDSLSISPEEELLDYRHSNESMGAIFMFNRRPTVIFEKEDYLKKIVEKKDYLQGSYEVLNDMGDIFHAISFHDSKFSKKYVLIHHFGINLEMLRRSENLIHKSPTSAAKIRIVTIHCNKYGLNEKTKNILIDLTEEIFSDHNVDRWNVQYNQKNKILSEIQKEILEVYLEKIDFSSNDLVLDELITILANEYILGKSKKSKSEKNSSKKNKKVKLLT